MNEPVKDTSWFADILLTHPSDYPAKRPTSSERGPSRRFSAGFGFGALGLIGVGLASVALLVAQTRPQVQETKSELADRVTALSARAQDWAAANASMRQRNVELQSLVLPDLDGNLAKELKRSANFGGYSKMTGGGLQVVLRDPARNPGTVLDTDLAVLVNGLFASGARAVTVDDIRITPTTAIRSAAGSVLIDYQPVTSPYVVRAIGRHLYFHYSKSIAKPWIDDLARTYDVEVKYRNFPKMTVQAGRIPSVTAAERLEQ